MQLSPQQSHQVKNVFASYDNREGRANFINQHFHAHLEQASSILDVGCDNNRLKPAWRNKVTGIDIEGTPDHLVDLEKEKLSRFDDKSFDLLICTDVLEHIDNLYEVLDDMVRVSKGKVIISLPNCGHIFRILPVIFGRSSGKFYGLPLTPPADRHKWFFNWRELHTFFHQYAKKKHLMIDEEFLSYGYRSPIRRHLLQILSPVLPITTFAQGYWIVLTIPSTSSPGSDHLTKRKEN